MCQVFAELARIRILETNRVLPYENWGPVSASLALGTLRHLSYLLHYGRSITNLILSVGERVQPCRSVVSYAHVGLTAKMPLGFGLVDAALQATLNIG